MSLCSVELRTTCSLQFSLLLQRVFELVLNHQQALVLIPPFGSISGFAGRMGSGCAAELELVRD